MKKLVLPFITGAFLFAAGNSDINQKLDLILQNLSQIDQKIDVQDKKINTLEKKVNIQNKKLNQKIKTQQKKFHQNLAISKCNGIKVKDFSYKYHGEVLPYYVFNYKLVNTYPKTIIYIEGEVKIQDKDGTNLISDFIKRKNVNIPANGGILPIVNKQHTVIADMEKELNGENTKNLSIMFEPTKIVFSDASKLSCGGLF